MFAFKDGAIKLSNRKLYKQVLAVCHNSAFPSWDICLKLCVHCSKCSIPSPWALSALQSRWSSCSGWLSTIAGFSSFAFSKLPSRTATFWKPNVVANLLWLSSLDLKSARIKDSLLRYLGRFRPKYGHVLAVVISAPYPSPTQTSTQHQLSTCFHKSAHISSEHRSWLQTAHMILLRTMPTVHDYRPNI